MKDDLLRRLRQKVVRTDNNGQSYFVSRNIDGDEAAGEIERLIAELAALRENSLAVLTRVRAYRDKVITERDALRAVLRPFAKAADNFDSFPIKDAEGWFAYSGQSSFNKVTGAITVGDLRRARAALGGQGDA